MLMSSPEIRGLLAQKKWGQMKSLLAKLEPSDVARLFQDCAPGEQVLLYRSLPASLAADTFSFLPEDDQEHLMAHFNEQETRSLLAELSPDDRTELFEEMPAATVQRLMNLLSPQDRKESLQLLGYPEDSVGRLMSPDLAKVKAEMTVAQALESLRSQARETETLNIIYVVDDRGKLLDEVRLRRLVISAPETKISDLMNGQYTALSAYEHEDRAVALMKQTGYFALPVTDSHGVLLGVVTADDVLDVAVEGATDDIHRSGAVQPLDGSLLDTPVWTLYLRRVSWLIALVVINILSGFGIAHYEALIEAIVALVFFLPLLIASGGNSGSQASTIVIRAMALGEVAMKDYLRLAWKESRVGLALGLSMSATVFVIAWVRSGTEVALVVSLAMVVVVAFGSMVGMSLPFIFQRLKMDPAAASGPLVTSVADVMGVLIYLGIASALLGHLVPVG